MTIRLNPSPTELTTAATDAALAVLSLVLLALLARRPGGPSFRTRVWESVFVLLAAGSALGAATHGFDMSATARQRLWQPLYLALGLVVGLFLVGGVTDWRGEQAARVVLPWALAAGVALFAVTQLSDNFTYFIVYESAAMIAALAMYLSLWISHRVPGAAVITLGIALTLVAAAVQVTALSVRIIWPFDHNGLFHLVQMPAVLLIATGVRRDRHRRPEISN